MVIIMNIEIIDVKKQKFCKDCRYFRKNPSWCNLKKKHTPRKKKNCNSWKDRKK